MYIKSSYIPPYSKQDQLKYLRRWKIQNNEELASITDNLNYNDRMFQLGRLYPNMKSLNELLKRRQSLNALNSDKRDYDNSKGNLSVFTKDIYDRNDGVYKKNYFKTSHPKLNFLTNNPFDSTQKSIFINKLASRRVSHSENELGDIECHFLSRPRKFENRYDNYERSQTEEMKLSKAVLKNQTEIQKLPKQKLSMFRTEIRKRRSELTKLKKLKERIYAVGKGITDGIINQWNSFSVIIDGINSGKLSVTIEGPSKSTINLKVLENGHYQVEYSVTKPGFYICNVNINHEPIKLSPILLIVKPLSTNLTRSMLFFYIESVGIDFEPIGINRVKATLTFIVNLNSSTIKLEEIRAYTRSPTNQDRNVLCTYKKPENVISVIFVADEDGKHEVTLTRKQRNNCKEKPMFFNSLPIWIQISDNPFSNGMLPKNSLIVYGLGICYAYCDRINYVFIERKDDMDYNSINVKVIGPTKPDVFRKMTNNGVFFSYRPNTSGVYIIHINDSDKPIIGSPFIIRAFSSNQEIVSLTQNRSICYGNGLCSPKKNNWNYFFIQVVKYPWSLENVEIHGAEAIVEHLRCNQLKSGVYLISYFPVETGRHTLLFIYTKKSEENAPFFINVR